MGTGKLYPNDPEQQNYPGQQIVVSDLVRYKYRPINRLYRVFPTVRTYSVETSPLTPDPDYPWGIEPVDDNLITYEEWWDELKADTGWIDYVGESLNNYSSALDIGDLDADGYDEIALAYANRILVVDPGAGDQLVRHIPFDSTWSYDFRFKPERSLALGDIDSDGRAEILSEMYLFRDTDYPSKLNLFEIMGDGTLQQTSTYNLPTGDDGGRLHAILVGDMDNDSFVSRLTGCADFEDAKIVAVLNGVPRWYANGQPINESRGTYSLEGDTTTGDEYGTKFNLGTSLSLGFEQEINIPFVGKVGSVRASVTTDFMSTQGIRNSTAQYESWGEGLGFEGLSLGTVIYESVATTCYFYDIYPPDSPQDLSKAMACIPAPVDGDINHKDSLDYWHTQAVKDAKGLSWADVGHQAPNGSHTNDLAIAGNYRPVLPVDEFMLVYEFNEIEVGYDPTLQFSQWSYQIGNERARTQFAEMELNTTVSSGVTAFGVSVDRSFTAGFGTESSQTMSWGESLAFEGRVYDFQDHNRLCYRIVPYVYQAKARTLAGVTYPYWEMDYYVTQIGGCTLQSFASP